MIILNIFFKIGYHNIQKFKEQKSILIVSVFTIILYLLLKTIIMATEPIGAIKLTISMIKQYNFF